MTTGRGKKPEHPSDDCDSDERLSPELVYVAGSGRNGSTLLGLQLEMSPDICFAGELTHLWERGWKENQLCGCGTAFRECEFWDAVFKEAFSTIVEKDVDAIIRLRRRISGLRGLVSLRLGQQHVDDDTVSKYGAVHQSLVAAIAKVSGRRIVVDSSKYPTDLATMLRADPKTKAIHLVRDCRAVVYSWRRKKKRTEIHWKDQLMPRYGAFQTALAWKQFNSVIGSLIQSPLISSRLLRYEDLVSDLPKELLDLTEWLGCRPTKDASNRCLGHSVSGNPCRFGFDHANVRPDTEWQTEMSWIDRWITGLLCRDLQKRYGY